MSTESVRDVVLWDADADRLVEVGRLIVQHEGRLRELSLRAARGTIRDLPSSEDSACLQWRQTGDAPLPELGDRR